MNKKSIPLIVGFDGVSMTSELQKRLIEINPMGVILFKRNIKSHEQVKNLVSEIRDLLGHILITIDHEGGIVNRFPEDCPTPPSAQALFHANSADIVEEACRIQAGLVKALGFNMNFAPVLDIYNSHAGHVIGSRSFSADPEELGRYGLSCIRAHQKVGIASTAKHFPGHGKSLIDSHLDVGNVLLTELELEAQDWIPFRRAIQEKVEAIMMAHLSFPKLDGEFPASLSEQIINQILKKRMNYQGLVILDCVEMAGISKVYSMDQIIEQGVFAKADLWISSFSLIKDPALQLQLAQKLRDMCQNSQNVDQAFISTRNKIRNIVNRHNKIKEDFNLKEEKSKNKTLYKRTLFKSRPPYLPSPSRGYVLLELSNSVLECINEATTSSLFPNEEGKGLLVEKKELAVRDLKKFQQEIKMANSRDLTVLLITRNGALLEGYESFINYLAEAKSSIHISLMSKNDFRGKSKNEWTPFGANLWTKKNLLSELKHLIS